MYSVIRDVVRMSENEGPQLWCSKRRGGSACLKRRSKAAHSPEKESGVRPVGVEMKQRDINSIRYVHESG